MFNSDMALYYLKALVAKGEPPENMVDVNIKTNYEKLKIIADIQRRRADLHTLEEIACEQM